VTVRVRLFASLREVVGRSELQLELPEGSSAEDAWRTLVGHHPALGPRRASLAAAVNRCYVDFAETLRPGDELVFLPPVSGG
jgi:molybdopterin converting factor subunit 1